MNQASSPAASLVFSVYFYILATGAGKGECPGLLGIWHRFNARPLGPVVSSYIHWVVAHNAKT